MDQNLNLFILYFAFFLKNEGLNVNKSAVSSGWTKPKVSTPHNFMEIKSVTSVFQMFLALTIIRLRGIKANVSINFVIMF